MSDDKDKAQQAQAKAKGEKGERKPPVNKTLFVRNLPETFDNQKLEQLFEDIGPIKRAFVVRKQDEPGCRGYGYVQFAVDKDAKNALLKLQGKAVAPKKLLLLDWAKQRPPKEERLERRGKGPAKPAKSTPAPSLNKVIKFGEEDDSSDDEEEETPKKSQKKDKKKKVKKEESESEESEEEEEDEKELDSEEEYKRELKELRALKGKKLDLSEFEPGTQDSDDIESRVLLNFRDYFDKDDFSDGEYEKAMSQFKKALEENDSSEDEESDDEDAKAKAKKKKKVKKEKKEDEEPVKEKKKKEEKKKPAKKVASDDDDSDSDDDSDEDKNDSQKTKKAPRLDPERLILIEKMNYFIKEEDIRRILKKEHLNCSKMTLEEEKNEDNPDDDENNVTARLLMASPEQALQAIALLEKTKVRGRTLQPKLMAEISKRSRLIVRNLSFGVTEKKLRKVFGAHGAIADIHIPKNAEGTSKGFAFVQFERMNSAAKAIEKANGFKLLGRPMAVDFSLPKHQFLKAQTMEKIAKLEEKAIDETEELIKLARANDPETFKSSSVKSEPVDKNLGKSKTESKSNKTTIKTEKMSDDEDDVPEVVIKDEKLDDDDEDDEDFDDEEHEEDEEDEEDEKEMDDLEKHHVDPTRPKPKLISNDVVKGTTLFIRNLAFDTTDQTLQAKFNEFGPLRFGVVVKNKETGQSKGSAFVQFMELKDADNCLRLAYPQFAKYIYKEPAEPTLEDKRKQKKSIEKLVEEWAAKCQRLKDQEIKEFKKVRESEIFLDGRALIITRAVDRSTAGKLSNRIDGDTKYFESDKRNIYLAKEGLITMEDPVAATIPPAEMKKRQKLWNETKEKLKNVNFKVSDTRISILNIPKTVDESKLREIAQKSFKVPTKIVQVKIVREKDRFDKNGKPASKGFGFVEFRKHEDALRALRFLNNNPDIFSEAVRPIVTFAIDNTFKLQRHERAKEFGARKTKTGDEGEEENEEKESAKEKKKKNRGAKQREKKRLRSEAGLSSSSSSSSSDAQQPPAKVHKPTASSTVSSATAQKKGPQQPSQIKKTSQKPAVQKKGKKEMISAAPVSGGKSQGIVPPKFVLPSAPGITETEKKELKKKKKKVDNFDQLVASFQSTFASSAKEGHWYDQ